ncbi:hypothetical protein [Thalassotalea sp. G2M2-11]|uniref:hypothetical protein n=1 Tax=Thalassotalea sp. G2M2-11 TaxID=2787627 RepID=UPI0019D21717|nr:hypothetical protein [Thalassotalea sp. G2M2-11]
MKLDIHLQQSQLLYLVRDDENINIKENNHYRFLCFDHIVQSIMLKRKNHQLTLPHQYFITLPLLFMTPKKVIELGLGGGNILRFIKAVVPDSQLMSVENNLQVIQCFEQYFNPDNIHIDINCQAANSWLAQQKTVHCHWLIFDIFQAQRSDLESVELIQQLLTHLTSKAWMTINLVDLTEKQLNRTLRYLSKIKQNRELTYFNVPQYKNIIVHLHPTIGVAQKEHSPLKPHQFNRWQQLWQHGISLS